MASTTHNRTSTIVHILHSISLSLSLGIAISTAGYPPSPAGQYPPMTPISLSGVDPMTLGNHMSSGSYSPPHSLSPKGTITTATVNGFTQVHMCVSLDA